MNTSQPIKVQKQKYIRKTTEEISYSISLRMEKYILKKAGDSNKKKKKNPSVFNNFG